MYRYLFIGNFLSKTRGTINPSEYIIKYFRQEQNITVATASSWESQVLRLFDILFKVIFWRYQTIHIDVFSNKAFIFADLASNVAKMRRKKIILNLHGGQLIEFYTKSPRNVEKVLNRADLILSPSLFLKAHFEGLGYSINYLPNFVDLEKFPFDRSSVKSNSILWVRAFTEIYNPELAIKTVAHIKDHIPNIKLTMIGPDKGRKKYCENLIKELQLGSHVDIIGKIPHDKLAHFYQTHAVYLNTTSYESFGVALLEAASCGIPIISTGVGEIGKLWENSEEAILMDSLDAKEFANEIIYLLNHPDKTELMAKRAHKKSRQFQWKKVRDLWKELVLDKF